MLSGSCFYDIFTMRFIFIIIFRLLVLMRESVNYLYLDRVSSVVESKFNLEPRHVSRDVLHQQRPFTHELSFLYLRSCIFLKHSLTHIIQHILCNNSCFVTQIYEALPFTKSKPRLLDHDIPGTIKHNDMSSW